MFVAATTTEAITTTAQNTPLCRRGGGSSITQNGVMLWFFLWCRIRSRRRRDVNLINDFIVTGQGNLRIAANGAGASSQTRASSASSGADSMMERTRSNSWWQQSLMMMIMMMAAMFLCGVYVAEELSNLRRRNLQMFYFISVLSSLIEYLVIIINILLSKN